MPHLTDEDFKDVDSHDKLNDLLSTSFGLSGQRGTREYVEDAVEALSNVEDDIFWDYSYSEYIRDNGLAATAASHANISRLQVGAAYAQEVLSVLAADPDLLARVNEALAKKAAQSPVVP